MRVQHVFVVCFYCPRTVVVSPILLLSLTHTHSGTVLDLPYQFTADDNKMRLDPAFNMNNLMSKLAQPEALACCACLLFMLLSGND
jgi:hypothetical protein